MRFPVLIIVFAGLSSLSAICVSAQLHPPMTEQRRDAEKESYFAAIFDLKRVPLPDSQRKAYEAAIEYLKRFEGDKDADAKTVRAFVTEYERGARQLELLSIFNSKNYAKTFETGRALLKNDPENFFVLSILTEAGIDNALAGDPSSNDATLTYGTKAIQLLEAGKVIKSDPFIDIEIARGYLNSAVGALLKEKSPAEAARAYRKAAQSRSSYSYDPIVYHRLGITILKGEFAQLSNEYNQKFGGQPASPAQQELLGRINKLGEQAIDAYARAVALSDPARAAADVSVEKATARPQFPPALRTKILEQLTALYRSFHNNSDAGLSDLIATVLTKPLP